MSESRGTIWPPLESAYTDEFGHIEPEVYKAAGSLWSRAERYALSKLGDAATGLRLMIRAVALVSRKHAAPQEPIANLTAYLFQTYKHLVLAELEKENGHRRREAERRAELEPKPSTVPADLDRKILLEQITRRMDEWMREVFELLILGYSFEEIGEARGKDAHGIRTKYNKQLHQLTNQLTAETDTAERRKS